MSTGPQGSASTTRHVSILGMARTGVATANALAGRGWDVLLSDTKQAEELAQPLAQLDRRVKVVTGRNEVRPGDLVVISPGIRPGSPTFAMAHELGSEVVSDVELFYRLSPALMLCVTGTDGKSTTTALLAAMCADAGLHTFLGGNIGVGIMEGLDSLAARDAGAGEGPRVVGRTAVDRSTCRDGVAGAGEGPRVVGRTDTDQHLLTPRSVAVVEVSCFQLIHCPTLRPRVAVYTNIAEDHLDYHGSYEAYQQAKRLLMANLGRGDTLVLNADDPILASWPLPGEATVLWYSRRGAVSRGCWIGSEDAVRIRRLTAIPEGTSRASKITSDSLVFFRDADGKGRHICDVQDIRIPGLHNLENALAATTAALAFGIPADSIRRTLTAFPGLEHRIEHVADIQEISFYNDSKATNPHAAIPGLSAFGERPVVAIVGGYEKGSDFTGLGQALARLTAAVVLIGQTAERIRAAIPADFQNIHRARTLEEAVRLAVRLTPPGGVVTLCPACASFDMFKDYEERGRAFKALVRKNRLGES